MDIYMYMSYRRGSMGLTITHLAEAVCSPAVRVIWEEFGEPPPRAQGRDHRLSLSRLLLSSCLRNS